MNQHVSPPLIGITTYERNAQAAFVLPAFYVDAVRRAGGVPILLPPGELHLANVLSGIDGLILSGGLDVDPALYDGQPHPKVEPPNRERDATEIELVRRVIEMQVPLLAICRGAQILNVALGGSLIEHLPDEVDESVAHQDEAGEPTAHSISVMAESFLARIVGETLTAPISWHHQAIRRVAAGLSPVAHATDGTIEAVEMPDHPWLIGVQWHPEMSAAEEATQQHLFDAFVAATRAFRRRMSQRIVSQ